MPCQILVAYQCAATVGEIVGVHGGDHVFSAAETLAAHGDKTSWNRNFTLIKVTDKNAAELAFLGDSTADTRRKYHFTVPAPGTVEYQDLNSDGEITCPWAVAELFLVERV